jgi:hypothetical protein
MSHYCGIDLHLNNHVVVVIDERDREIQKSRHPHPIHNRWGSVLLKARCLVSNSGQKSYNQ